MVEVRRHQGSISGLLLHRPALRDAESPADIAHCQPGRRYGEITCHTLLRDDGRIAEAEIHLDARDGGNQPRSLLPPVVDHPPGKGRQRSSRQEGIGPVDDVADDPHNRIARHRGPEQVQFLAQRSKRGNRGIAERIDPRKEGGAVLFVLAVRPHELIETLPPRERTQVGPIHSLRLVHPEGPRGDIKVGAAGRGIEFSDLIRNIGSRLSPPEDAEEEFPRLPERDAGFLQLFRKAVRIRSGIECGKESHRNGLVMPVSVDRVVVRKEHVGFVLADGIHKAAEDFVLPTPFVQSFRGRLGIAEIEEVEELDFRTEDLARSPRLFGTKDAKLFIQLGPFFILPALAPRKQHRVCFGAVFHPIIRQGRSVLVIGMRGDIHHHEVVGDITDFPAECLSFVFLGEKQGKRQHRKKREGGKMPQEGPVNFRTRHRE